MEIVRDLLGNSEQPAIRHYHPGELRVRSDTYTASVIITPWEVFDDWAPQLHTELQPPHLERLLQLDPRPEIILLGTGESQHCPPAEIMAPLFNAGVGVEVMDTAAACRTWNILLTEGRSAAAALIIR